MLNSIVKITSIAALVGCASTSTHQSVPDACPANYQPHLCLATIGGATYGGYGTNKCLARQKLAENLERLGINAPESAIECGEVAQ